MKNKLNKIFAVAIMAIIVGLSGSIAFANATENSGKKSAKIAVKHPKTVRISVTKDGFSPSEIRVEKGYPLTMIFNRSDSKGCGKEVVFTALNIRKKLPLKKDVTIVITPAESGEIAFACGMGMMKGKIVAR